MSTTQQLPEGLTDILREAAAIIRNIDPNHAPANLRFPIVDELEGFANMLSEFTGSAEKPSAAPARPLQESDIRWMRRTLEDIYQGLHSEHFDHWMTVEDMAAAAKTCAVLEFERVCPEQAALRAIYEGSQPAANPRLDREQITEIAKPFVDLPDEVPPAQPVSPIYAQASPEPYAYVDPIERNRAVAETLGRFLAPGQKVVWWEGTAWHDDLGQMTEPYCYQALSAMASELEYDILVDYHYVAIVSRGTS